MARKIKVTGEFNLRLIRPVLKIMAEEFLYWQKNRQNIEQSNANEHSDLKNLIPQKSIALLSEQAMTWHWFK